MSIWFFSTMDAFLHSSNNSPPGTNNNNNSNPENSANNNNNLLANLNLFSFPPQLFNSRPFTPISDKLGERNHKTWQQQALATVRGQLLENHLYKYHVPPRFTMIQDQQNGIKSSAYTQWLQDDYNLQS
ncbi:Retrovirus-related Pol polyprotein [Arachis hypogaea]|nr:Retrovirus-related Pol polyprotein [Arachis hypogaea]